MDKVPVVVAAAGAAWETTALARLEGGAPAVVMLKRCVDLRDLLATAYTGLARVALVSAGLPGLDADSVEALRRGGIEAVVVYDEAGSDPGRLQRLGVAHVLAPTMLDTLVDTVHAAGCETGEPDLQPAPEREGLPVGEPGGARGRVLAVWGPAGAPGRTTVAVGVAAELALLGRPALLVDADPYAGAVAQHLGVLDEVSGLLAAARLANAGSLDVERLGSCARKVVEHLHVLTGLPRPDRWREVRPRAFADLLDLATRTAAHVVVDTGFSLERDTPDPFDAPASARNLMTLEAVERADDVLVVGTADPVGLARLARGLIELHQLLPALRPLVVVNRYRTSLGWGEKEIRGMVEGFVATAAVHFVPDDREAADRALMAGRSLVESGDSALRRGVARVADGLVRPAGASSLDVGADRRTGRRLGRRRLRR
jgi:MinD-like ATPase involved in chromosome partitioning or flagellar assembly